MSTPPTKEHTDREGNKFTEKEFLKMINELKENLRNKLREQIQEAKDHLNTEIDTVKTKVTNQISWKRPNESN